MTRCRRRRSQPHPRRPRHRRRATDRLERVGRRQRARTRRRPAGKQTLETGKQFVSAQACGRRKGAAGSARFSDAFAACLRGDAAHAHGPGRVFFRPERCSTRSRHGTARRPRAPGTPAAGREDRPDRRRGRFRCRRRRRGRRVVAGLHGLRKRPRPRCRRGARRRLRLGGVRRQRRPGDAGAAVRRELGLGRPSVLRPERCLAARAVGDGEKEFSSPGPSSATAIGIFFPGFTTRKPRLSRPSGASRGIPARTSTPRPPESTLPGRPAAQTTSTSSRPKSARTRCASPPARPTTGGPRSR